MKKHSFAFIALAAMPWTGMTADGSMPDTEASEFRAVALEKVADDARFMAEMAKIGAVHYENMVRQITIEAQQPDRGKSRNAEPRAELFWILTETLLHAFVPPHARNANRSKNYPSQRRNRDDGGISDIMKKADEAWLEVGRTRKTADTTKSLADAARASADAARRSYETCLCR